jgi:hypothetical protein
MKDAIAIYNDERGGDVARKKSNLPAFLWDAIR